MLREVVMLDWARIEELREEIGADDFAEVAEIFLDELEEVMERLQSGGTSEDTAEQLHFLKGCALNLGFSTMAQLASQGEAVVKGGGTVDLAELMTAYGASRADFTARFVDATAA